MKDKRPLILLSNDDGIEAKGMQTLATLLEQLGDLWVVAPKEAHSGMSSATTTSRLLRYWEYKDGATQRQFVVDGTPVDCFKMAIHVILPAVPDLVVAGINHGSNASINVIYSGTMAVAIDGALAGVPSIGFSRVLGKHDSEYEELLPYATLITKNVLEHGLPRGVCLNVNFPRYDVQGIRVCRQAPAVNVGEMEPIEKPDGEVEWKGHYDFMNLDFHATDTDDWALRHGYISVVPIQVDFTDFSAINALKEWKWSDAR